MVSKVKLKVLSIKVNIWKDSNLSKNKNTREAYPKFPMNPTTIKFFSSPVQNYFPD